MLLVAGVRREPGAEAPQYPQGGYEQEARDARNPVTWGDEAEELGEMGTGEDDGHFCPALTLVDGGSSHFAA